MKQAVILAAGEGLRLRPFTVNRPKGMLFIAGKPILQYVVEALAQNGIRNIVLVVGYKKEQVFDYLGSGEQLGVEITYVTQEKQLGTADALALVKEVTEGEFLVLPGDKLIEADTIAEFAAIKPEAILVKKVPNPSRYGVVSAEQGIVKEIIEKPEKAGVLAAGTSLLRGRSRLAFLLALLLLSLPLHQSGIARPRSTTSAPPSVTSLTIRAASEIAFARRPRFGSPPFRPP